MPRHCPEFPTKAIRIAPAGNEREASPIQQFQQSVAGGFADRPFVAAVRGEDFRRIDIGDPDLFTPKPDRIAVDNTINADRFIAESKPFS